MKKRPTPDTTFQDIPDTPSAVDHETPLRGLARTITKAGYATRRQAEEMIRAGRVQVDDRRILDPSEGVGPDCEIRIDGTRIIEVIRTYLAFHKPLNVATSSTVSHRTRLISEFLPSEVPGLSSAGRLDPHTSGLLLVSNDSAWNAKAASGHGFDKEFLVYVDGEMTDIQLSLIASGVQVPKSGLVKPVSISMESLTDGQTVVRMVLREGKNRQIRNLFQALRQSIRSIHRLRIGPVSIDAVSPGRWRVLSSHEVEAIRNGPEESQPQKPDGTSS